MDGCVDMGLGIGRELTRKREWRRECLDLWDK